MNELPYILSRIDEGARVRLTIDYFGQSIVIVPRRWLLGKRKIKLASQELRAVEQALRARRSRRRLPPLPSAARS